MNMFDLGGMLLRVGRAITPPDTRLQHSSPLNCGEEEVDLNLSPPGILLFLVECPLLSPARLLSLLLQLLPRFR